MPRLQLLVQLRAEHAEQRCPQNEENKVPHEGPEGLKEWDAVDDNSNSGENTDGDAVTPTGVVVVFVKVGTVESDDGDGENELDKAEEGPHSGEGETARLRFGVAADIEGHFGGLYSVLRVVELIVKVVTVFGWRMR